jgi:hypothetical protein
MLLTHQQVFKASSSTGQKSRGQGINELQPLIYSSAIVMPCLPFHGDIKNPSLTRFLSTQHSFAPPIPPGLLWGRQTLVRRLQIDYPWLFAWLHDLLPGYELLMSRAASVVGARVTD